VLTSIMLVVVQFVGLRSNRRGLSGLAMSRFWFNLGRRLVDIFVPLLIMSSSHLPLGQAVRLTLAFYLTTLVITTLLFYPGMVIINRYGVRMGFIVAYVAAAVFQVVLGITTGHLTPWGLLALAVSLATANALALLAMGLYIGRTLDVTRKGRNMAIIQMSSQVTSVVSPLLGAIIAVTVGSVWLNVMAALLVLFSLVHIWHADRSHPDEATTPTTSATPPAPATISYRPLPPWRDLMAVWGLQYSSVAGLVVWPVYLAVVKPSFQAIGGIVVSASLLALGYAWVVGRRVDRGSSRRTMLEAIAVIAIINCVRCLSVNSVWLSAVSAVFDMAFVSFNVSWSASYGHHAHELGPRYVLGMETMGGIANIALWASLWLLASTGVPLSWVFRFAFFSAALAMGLCALIRRNGHT
jgi:hypothetical protein